MALPTWLRRSGVRARDVERPARSAFTAAEQRVIRRLTTPAAVQHFLNELPYNTELARRIAAQFPRRDPQRTAHCLEAALSAAVILEQHGYPPLVLSFESIDEPRSCDLRCKTRTGWGSVARSRDLASGRRQVHLAAESGAELRRSLRRLHRLVTCSTRSSTCA